MADAKRVVVTGATGLIGKKLCPELMDQGYQVEVLSRNAQRARRSLPGMTNYIDWTPYEHREWANVIDGAYAVIHLAGAPLFGKRWDEAYKETIRNSRVISTRVLFSAMVSARTKPEVFLSGSAIGYYGDRQDTTLDETASVGNDFLADVCAAWEKEAMEAEELGIRTVLLRTGIVLDRDEGALAQMVLPFRLLMGGPILPGTQWLSWIHIFDQIGLMMLALEDTRVRGPLNLSAPNPHRNRDFTNTLARVFGTPSWLPVPGLGLKLVLGEAADMLEKGQRVIPKRAQELGYQFRFPTLEPALHDLLK